MKKEIAIALLKVLGSKKLELGSLPWVHGQCPLARWKHQKGTDSHPSFGILTGKARARCHCLSCNTSGRPEEIIGEIMMLAKGDHGYDLREAERLIESDESALDLSTDEEQRYDQPLMPFPEAFWASFTPAMHIPEAVEYLNGRGINAKEIQKHDLRWDGLSRRVCACTRGFDQKLYGVRGRAIDKGVEPRYHNYPYTKITNPQVWLGEDIVDFDQPILLVEATFQRIAALRVYPNTVAPLSASLHKAQAMRMAKGWSFVHLFDADKAGRRASEKMREFLPEASHIELFLPEGTGPDDVPFDELMKIVGQVLPVPS